MAAASSPSGPPNCSRIRLASLGSGASTRAVYIRRWLCINTGRGLPFFWKRPRKNRGADSRFPKSPSQARRLCLRAEHGLDWYGSAQVRGAQSAEPSPDAASLGARRKAADHLYIRQERRVRLQPARWQRPDAQLPAEENLRILHSPSAVGSKLLEATLLKVLPRTCAPDQCRPKAHQALVSNPC